MGRQKTVDNRGDDGLKMFAVEYGFISVRVILTCEDMNVGIRGA